MVLSLKALMLYLDLTNGVSTKDRATKAIKLTISIGKRLEYVVEYITSYWQRSS
jgi:hypothetical protein